MSELWVPSPSITVSQTTRPKDPEFGAVSIGQQWVKRDLRNDPVGFLPPDLEMTEQGEDG